jgi:hypothetical protein
MEVGVKLSDILVTSWAAGVQFSLEYFSSASCPKQQLPHSHLTLYCTVLAVLVGDNRLGHSIFHSLYFRLHRRYYTTVELELSNSRIR